MFLHVLTKFIIFYLFNQVSKFHCISQAPLKCFAFLDVTAASFKPQLISFPETE